MSFQVPYSSSPPSTPDRKSSNGNAFSFGANASTTPAGPPPSSAGSFTPAGPPPTSFLGSSVMGTTSSFKQPLFSQQQSPTHLKLGNYEVSPSAEHTKSQNLFQRSRLSNEYQASPQSGFQAPNESEEEEEGEGEEEDGVEYLEEEDDPRYDDQQEYNDEDADAMEDEDGPYDDDENMDYESELPGSKSNGRGYDQRSSSDLLLSTPGGLRRSREGGMLGLRDSMAQSERSKPSVYGKIAKSLYSQMGTPAVTEADDVVINTEAIVTTLYEDGIGITADDNMLQEALVKIPGELIQLWVEYQRRTAVYDSEEYTTSIGPGPRATDFAKANFLAGLTLQIHHPQSDPKSTGFERRLKPLPQTMLEWIYEHHDPYPSQFEEIQAHRPSPANHRLFWDTIFNGLLRGKVMAVISLMKDAGWRYARDTMGDIRDHAGQVGYSGVALASVEKVIGAATHVLTQCPAIHGDWNIRGSDWTLFRLRVSQALEDLRSFAEGRNRSESTALEPEGFGRSSMGRSGTYSKTAKKAESQVPWNIYQNLLTLYSLVMGDRNAIIENAQDWCEATVGLLVWWDEGKDERRLALGRPQSTYRAAARDSDGEAYLRKLRKSFESATDDSTDFQVNTLDVVEVGLASLLEGDNEAVLGFLRAWSGPISSAVAEVASVGGWLPPSEPQNLITMGDLDQDDMDLLGFNSSPTKADGVKDQTLITFAKALSQRQQLKIPKTFGRQEVIREGWELAIAVLGRLDSAARSEEMVGDFLAGFSLDSSDTVDKLWRLLNDIGMSRHAESTAESYADLLAEGSHNYGEALWYYALSHKPKKVKDVLDLLISYSLIQSVAYPAEPELDDHLRRLISSPENALNEISKMDVEAAELLHKILSGYATLRKFYTLRDEEVLGSKSQMGAIARKAEAASALMVVISSSDDNIRGGLYDEQRGAVVSVDFLLALLGEALVFVNRPGSPITVSHIDILLKAIEDLQAVEPRVYSACTGFLQTVIASGQGLEGSTPSDMLRKSTSNVSGTSSNFSLVGSSMLASQLKQSIGSSGVLVKGNLKRGWDWRKGISATTTGDDLLRILRPGLAKDLAKAWLLEADNKM